MTKQILRVITISLMIGLSACGEAKTNATENQEHSADMQEHVKVDTNSVSANAQTFKVEGNCGMCKTRIETAAKSVEGVTSAVWNEETKMMDVTLEEGTDIHKVHMAIAAAGHDTEMHKAEDAVYNALPGCCQYR